MKQEQGKSIGEKKRSILVQGGTQKSLLTLLKEKNEYLDAPCNGNGSCGKCKVQLTENLIEPTEQEMRLLTKEELAGGVRLACQTRLLQDSIVLLPENIDEMIAENTATVPDVSGQFSTDMQQGKATQAAPNAQLCKNDLGIAIDLGTTTIAAVLVELSTGKELAAATGINHQRAYGADVISRIKASVEGSGRKLQQIVQTDLLQIINELLLDVKAEKKQLKRMVIAANTTMCHLLSGYPCDTLGKAPFTPVDIRLQKRSSREVFETEEFQAEVTILPGISTFIGADITAGIYACGMQEKEEYSLFLDIGTNGEMAVGNKHGLFVTSTAAGPAFEGGNLSCGMASVPGAVDKVEICFPYTKVHTLKEKAALGICGTGVIETVYELKRNRIIDANGTFAEQFIEEGYPLVKGRISFSQQDVREFQMAKAAVRAGMERLLTWSQIPKEALTNIYLAGSFGCHIPVKKAIGIGLLPAELERRIQTVGNTALEGAKKYLLCEQQGQLEQITSIAKELVLAADCEFQEDFLAYMNF